MNQKLSIFVKLIISLLLFFTSAAFALDLRHEPEVRAYITAVSKKYDFNENQLTSWFRQVQFNPEVIAKMTQPPGRVIPWYAYRDLFITDERIREGVAYWRKNAKALAAAEREYGVPASVIVGIIGVETSYGGNKGHFSAFDTLSTLAFRYPSRSKFFMNELTQFLLLTREQGWNPFSIKGSYAGALGLPQFMPSSYRIYAISAEDNGLSDLFHNNRDAIASVANYLQKKGWRRGEPVALPAKVVNQNFRSLSDQDGRLRFSIGELANYGLEPEKHVPSSTRAGVLFFDGGDAWEHWLTFANFQVIKRYNESNRYALVVYELGSIIKKQVAK
ncbi:MAG TPA: lytic murein transglycosylase B [Gammaproteobacteria bacterium]|nr:lytic murein transglycosylase B [Gammaproteobacteria bacterium]